MVWYQLLQLLICQVGCSLCILLFCETRVSMGGKTFHVTGTHSRAQFSHVLFSDLLALAGLGCLPTLCSTRQIVRLTSVNLDLDVQASFFSCLLLWLSGDGSHSIACPSLQISLFFFFFVGCFFLAPITLTRVLHLSVCQVQPKERSLFFCSSPQSHSSVRSFNIP